VAKIVDVEVISVAMPADRSWFESGFDETLVVRLTDENGLQGIGDCYASPAVTRPWFDMTSMHMWSRNLTSVLQGADPLDRAALWDRMYEGTIFPGRRGAAIHAISAADIAVTDLAARQLGLPVWKYLGGSRQPHCIPYATIFPGMARGGQTVRDLMKIIEKQFRQVIGGGYRVVKMEVLFYDLCSDTELIGLIGEGRRMVGDAITMAVDFGYRWRHWQDAKYVIDRIADHNIFFAEAALQHDDLPGHAALARTSPVRVAGAEFAATRWECRDWIETGGVTVVQPGITRAGGFTEMMRIAEFADQKAVEVVPLAWHTGITAAAALHFQAATINTPAVEFFPTYLFDSPLREHLVSPEFEIRDGKMKLPEEPGLGVTLNEDIIAKFGTGQAGKRPRS
jgi:L-rhamnonate dehydratase